MKLEAVSIIDKAINELCYLYKCSCYDVDYNKEFKNLNWEIASHQRNMSQWLLQELKFMKKRIIRNYNKRGEIPNAGWYEIWIINNFPLLNYDYSTKYINRILSNNGHN